MDLQYVEDELCRLKLWPLSPKHRLIGISASLRWRRAQHVQDARWLVLLPLNDLSVLRATLTSVDTTDAAVLRPLWIMVADGVNRGEFKKPPFSFQFFLLVTGCPCLDDFPSSPMVDSRGAPLHHVMAPASLSRAPDVPDMASINPAVTDSMVRPTLPPARPCGVGGLCVRY